MQHFKPLYLGVLLAICAAAGCEKVPLTSPTGSTITLSIDKTSVPIGGTATLIAVVTEASGTAPQNGTMVTFNSAFGTITPQEAPTVGGIARATFTGTASGTAKVGAFSGPAKATEVELKVGAAAAATLTLRAEPPAVLGQTGGVVTVIAKVVDAGGSPLPNTAVTFTAGGGLLSASTQTTDSNGEARVTLTTGSATVVTAFAGALKADVTVAVVPAPTVTVGSCSTTPLVGVAVNCTITPTVPTGGAPIANATINWGDGTGDQNLGPITGATVASHIYSRGDNYTVTVTATDVAGQVARASTAVNVGRSLPTVTMTCPGGTQTVGVAGSFTVTPAANPPIQIANITVDLGDGTSRNLGTPTGPTSFTKAYSAEGGYTVTATITDVAGQRGSSSCSVVVGRAASPTVTLTQTSDMTTPATPAVPESFSVSATTASGVTLQSLVVRRSNGEVLYNGTGNGSFAASVTVNEVLTATATDSAGNTGTAQLIVK